jgi:hypothetical protein
MIDEVKDKVVSMHAMNAHKGSICLAPMLILKIWEKEVIPVYWKDSIICPIYKKGDRMQCENYRPITLMNVVYKIFTTILSNRLSEIMESKLGEYQAGF